MPEHLTDEQVLFLTDIFPTGYTGIDWGNVNGGESVAIFGAGPVGIMAAKSAWLRGAGRVVIVDTLKYRLDKAKAISMSLRAIAKGNTSLESAVEYYAEVLDCKASDLGGVDG